jgi:hypothetical protein
MPAARYLPRQAAPEQRPARSHHRARVVNAKHLEPELTQIEQQPAAAAPDVEHAPAFGVGHLENSVMAHQNIGILPSLDGGFVVLVVIDGREAREVVVYASLSFGRCFGLDLPGGHVHHRTPISKPPATPVAAWSVRVKANKKPALLAESYGGAGAEL